MVLSRPSVSDFAVRLLIAGLLFVQCVPALAQAAGADYTAGLPSVQRVETEIKGSDPTDALARQVAVFNYLVAYIDRIKYNRSYTGPYTPGEQKMNGAYRLAAYQISQEYAKSHTAAEAAAFERLHGQYEEDSAFYADWSKRLIGSQTAAAYKGAEAGLAATQKAHIDAINKANAEPQPQTTNAQGLSQDPTAVATRRCLELGGSSLACVGKSFVGGLISMTGIDLDAMKGPGRAGVVLSGVYGTSSGPSVGFSGDSASVIHCGTLVPASASYNLGKSGPSVQVTVAIEPHSITLSLRPDGSLAGPGLVTLNGQIITGYSTTTKQLYVDGAPAAAQGYDCGGPCTTSTSTPNYAPKTERCTIGQLAAPPLPPPSSAAPQDGGLSAGLTGFVNTIAGGSLPGLRMEGKYSTGSGLLLDFQGDAVILDCGQAHVKAPYSVENAPSQFLVHIQNSGGPFTLAFGSDNTLHGSGSTAVNGRLVSGTNGDDVAFMPHSETCAIGTFSPRGSASSTTLVAASPPPTAPATVAAVATAATSGPRAGFRVLLGSSFSGANPLAGQTVFVMRKPIDEVLRELGVSVPPNATAAIAMKAFQTFCHSPQGCSSVITGLRSYYVAGTKLDGSGNATLSATAATGAYYFFAVAPASSAGSLLWDLPANLVAGDNTVTFTDANAQRMQ